MTTTDDPIHISSTPQSSAPPATGPARHGDPPPPAEVPHDSPLRGPTMPAGRVLGVMVVGLLLASLLNADALVRRAKGEASPEWRVSVAESVQTVSDALMLNRPRQAIDDLRGRTGVGDATTDEVQAERAAAAGGGGSPGATTATTTEPGQPALPPDTPPTLRAPTAADPLRVWVGGDSMSSELANSVKGVFEPTGVFDVTTDPKVSSGLSRPDFFNWPQHLNEAVVPIDPATGEEPADAYELMIIMFGANDSQNIPLPDGSGLSRLSPEWLAEYRDRVAATMDLLRHAEDERVVIWVGQPIMGPGSGVRGMDQLNHIYWDEASKRPWIVYFDTWPFFARPDGVYADELPSADGTVRPMRTGDDIHFSVSGANRLAWAILGRVGEIADLAAWGGTPDASQAPPPDVAERDEVPPTSPGGDG